MRLTGRQRAALRRIIIATVATAVLLCAGVTGWVRLVLFLAVYLYIGHDILRKALWGIFHGRVFDENFLMAVATVGAFALALCQHTGDYTEAVAVMLLYQTGEFFQSCAVGKSRRDIAALMDIRPDYADVDREGRIVRVDPEDVEVGETILLRPGERVPLDGTVTQGESALDTSALTGESIPRDVRPGDEIISGSINLSGVLKMRVTKPFGLSTVSRIMELVEDSASRKSKSENFISKFARVYTPAVCYGAAALALLPPLVLILAGSRPVEFATFEPWIYRALVFLVISCPCALVVSIPLTFFAAIGGAGRRGVLVKGSNILETLSRVRTVVFDKTGTVTRGCFSVRACHDSQDQPMDASSSSALIRLAAAVEASSTHPLAQSLRQAAGQTSGCGSLADVHEISGRGVTAMLDGKAVAVGNESLMESLGMTPCRCRVPGTAVHVASEGHYAGHILLGDELKPTAAHALASLRNSGVTDTVMLTGDNAETASDVASQLGINRVFSRLLPADKVSRLEEIIASAAAENKVAFVGDGINDAPVLSRADVGIAMGGIGSDAAIEAADVVIMDDDPGKIALAIRISRRCLSIVRWNIIMALGIKGVCLLLGVMGIVNMWLAIFADVGVMVLAVLNAMRAMYLPAKLNGVRLSDSPE